MNAEEVLQWWSFGFLGVVVYTAGQQIKRVFPALVNQPWYKRTVVFHAPLVATIIAVLPWFPMPDNIGSAIGTRILYGLVAGICCSWSYKAIMRLLGRDTKSVDEEAAVEEP